MYSRIAAANLQLVFTAEKFKLHLIPGKKHTTNPHKKTKKYVHDLYVVLYTVAKLDALRNPWFALFSLCSTNRQLRTQKQQLCGLTVESSVIFVAIFLFDKFNATRPFLDLYTRYCSQ